MLSGEQTIRPGGSGGQEMTTFRFERDRRGGGYINVQSGSPWWVLESDREALTKGGSWTAVEPSAL